MTEDRFKVVDHLLASKPWDFFMLVEIGVDQVPTGSGATMTPPTGVMFRETRTKTPSMTTTCASTPRLASGSPDFDQDTVVLVVSDHGAKRMDGGSMNEWLWREGYLVFEEDPSPGSPCPWRS